MKLHRAELVAKILMTAVIVVLVGLLIAWTVGVFKDKKQDLNSGSEKIDGSINAMAEFDLLVYDDKSIDGDSLVKLITDVVSKNPELSVEVQTLVNAKKTTPVIIYYNRFLGAGNVIDTSGKVGTTTALDQSSKSSDNYITPTANFEGKILKNPNNEITGILFTQQK